VLRLWHCCRHRYSLSPFTEHAHFVAAGGRMWYRPVHEVIPQPGSAGRYGYLHLHLKNSAGAQTHSWPLTRSTGSCMLHESVYSYRSSKRRLSETPNGWREVHYQLQRRCLLPMMSRSGVPAHHVTYPIEQKAAGRSSIIIPTALIKEEARSVITRESFFSALDMLSGEARR
jgi:hypothetical protein